MSHTDNTSVHMKRLDLFRVNIYFHFIYCMQRSLTEQQRASLTSDLKGLNLTKYIQEAVSFTFSHQLRNLANQQNYFIVAGNEHCRSQTEGTYIVVITIHQPRGQCSQKSVSGFQLITMIALLGLW